MRGQRRRLEGSETLSTTDDLFETGRMLVVAPHLDDEVLGAGGTIARLADAGAEVVIAVVTRARRRSSPTNPRPRRATRRGPRTNSSASTARCSSTIRPPSSTGCRIT